MTSPEKLTDTRLREILVNEDNGFAARSMAAELLELRLLRPIESSTEPVARAKPAVYISANDVLALVPDDMADIVRGAFEALPEPPMGEKVLPLYLAAPVSVAPAVTDEQKVKVKPLEWHDSTKGPAGCPVRFRAWPIPDFVIWIFQSGAPDLWYLSYGSGLNGRFLVKGGEDEAKAAAQLDYETRILSALELLQ